jgi:hypothetical protein
MKTAPYLKLIFCLLLFLLPLGTNFAHSYNQVFELPVEPAKSQQSKKIKHSKKQAKISKIPKERSWGVWTLAIGSYLIVFALFSALFFLGFYFYLYLLALLLLIFIFGVYLTITGVSIIDQTYIHYSDNAEMMAERLRPSIFRDFFFAGLMALAILGLIILEFYLSAWLCLIAVLALITLAAMKISALKKALSDSKKEKIE